MSKIRERVNQILEEWEKELENSSWNWNPNERELCLEFKADPHSEVGFGNDDPMYQVYFNISKHDGDDSAEFHEEVNEAKFKILEFLERMVWTVCQENTGNDPCSFEYKVNTQHLGDEVDFEVTVTDYFS